MAEKTEKTQKVEKTEKRRMPTEADNEVLVRIMGQDIRGDKNIYTGLTRIKGVSWAISNAVCNLTKIDRKVKISELGKERIALIESTLSDLKIPAYMKNRQNDFETGETTHITGVKLDMRKEFDIKRLKQIKSYKGNRHALRLPVRGQRTRSHFRKSGIAVGVKKPKAGKKS